MKGTKTLPGMEETAIEAVSNAALSLFHVCDEMKALKERRGGAELKPMSELEAHGLHSYHHPEGECFVEIEEKEKVKVSLGKGGGESPVTAPGPDAPISEQTLKPFPKKKKLNAGVPRAQD